MTLDPTLVSLMNDTITVEPYTGQSQSQAPTYGPAATYNAQVLPWTGRSIMGPGGKEFVPQARVILEGRILIDPRSRVTLPSDVLIAGTRSPPIRAVQPGPANNLNMDYTELLFLALLALPLLVVMA